MSDMNDKELDELENEDEIENCITLTDDDGNEVSFEIIGTVEYKEHLYGVLLPWDDEDDFVSVDDDALLNEVFEEFKKNYDGEYEFE